MVMCQCLRAVRVIEKQETKTYVIELLLPLLPCKYSYLRQLL